MLQKKILGCVFLLCSVFSAFAQENNANYQVIPLPQVITPVVGKPFNLNGTTSINYTRGNAKLKKNALFLASYIKATTGLQLNVIHNKTCNGFITLKIDTTLKNREAYRLNVTSQSIIISGATEAGVFYGIQTLRKSLPRIKNTKNVIFPAVKVIDYPRFEYRGMHLDVGRHFFSVSFIKNYIDILALHNVNNFHWHLTEDQGWRIEIKKYPNLTKIGSKRTESIIGHSSDKYDGIPHEGFYTQDQIKEIVAYAKERYINIVPEIDMPGHMLAALASYPDLGCTGGPYEVGKHWGVYDEVLCAGNEKTFEFVENVLTELIQLFPSAYIHIGGDECPKVSWVKCDKCQARIKAEGLVADEKHTVEQRLQSYFISRIEKFLNSKGRNIIGWDEILEGGLAPNATVMSWRGINGGIEASKQKHNVIMTPTNYCYFDNYQYAETANEPIAQPGFLPVEKVYSYDPIPTGLAIDKQKYILGTQANLWSEYISTGSQAEYMLLPRLAALCEVQWTIPERKNYQNFLLRVPALEKIYIEYNYNYAKHIFTN